MKLSLITFFVLVVGVCAGAALADPPTKTHNYYAQVAAGTRPDDRAGLRGPNAPSFMRAPAQSTAVRPDDRAGIRGIGAPELASTQVSASKSGFDWLDAGIGAGSTLLLILVGGGVFLIGGRRRGSARGSLAPALHG